MQDVGGMSFAEIARELKITRNAVVQIYESAMNKILSTKNKDALWNLLTSIYGEVEALRIIRGGTWRTNNRARGDYD